MEIAHKPAWVKNCETLTFLIFHVGIVSICALNVKRERSRNAVSIEMMELIGIMGLSYAIRYVHVL